MPEQPSNFQDPLMGKIATHLERSVPEPYLHGYNAIVNAGLKLMFSEQTSKFIEQGSKGITGHPNDIPLLVHFTMNMLQTLWKASDGKMQQEATPYAMQMLAMHGLDFYDRIGKIEISPALIDQFFPMLGSAILKFFGIDQSKVQSAIEQGRQGLLKEGGQAEGQPPAPAEPAGPAMTEGVPNA